MASSIRLFATTVLATLHLTGGLVSAQSCYFPGGAVDNDSGICEGSSVCCPLNWECISNGLCYLASEEYFQRSSCTDDSWGTECPQFCTEDGDAVENGNEAVAQCSDGSYCCDRNRPEVDGDDTSKSCCALRVRSINIEDGTATATVLTKAPGSTKSSSSATSSAIAATSMDSGSASDSTSTSFSPSSSSSTTSSTSSTRKPQASMITTQAATTNSAGEATTVMIVTTAVTTPTSAPTHGSSPSLGTIVGIATGIPVALAAATLLAFLLWRRRRGNKTAPCDAPTSERKELVDMYGNTTHDGKPPEADGYPVASVTKPGHLSLPISEMSGSPAYGNQQYSPRSAVSPITTKSFSNHNSVAPTANGFGFGVVPEERPQELWGGDIPRQPRPQDFTPMPPMPYGGGSYPGQPTPYQPAPQADLSMQAGRKSGEGLGAARAGGQYSAFQGVSGLSDGKSVIESAQSPPPGEDKMRTGQGGLRVVNQ
ncbi:hypothetical protein DOTSEDRAFT_24286 [Dothistroma septosporum NZE10]|uniref:Mid2 domain-containing protein n=1 Tax=Dothistroma septosporum (strain NZE10 / CBS 128990) TaxID=675120 RepID=N1PMR2_DOTSN|nr:hypothetical protein DOTSEDRAFT_24286 [Dothistroma septosporum NZE10]